MFGQIVSPGACDIFEFLCRNVNFWWPFIRSIFNFISFPGIADQGGGSQKVLSSSIGYSGVEIEKMCSNRGSPKMQKMKKLFFSNFLAILIASLRKIKPFINKKFMPWLVEQDSQSSARRVIRCSGKSSAEVLATFWDLLLTNVNFWWPSMRSIFNFILFPGTADQGGGSQKVLSSSIGYLGVEIEKMCSNRGSQKMKKMKKLIFSNFWSNFNSKFAKNQAIYK